MLIKWPPRSQVPLLLGPVIGEDPGNEVDKMEDTKIAHYSNILKSSFNFGFQNCVNFTEIDIRFTHKYGHSFEIVLNN